MYRLLGFGDVSFRTRCDGTVNDPYCEANCSVLGPYSSGGRLVCHGIEVGVQPPVTPVTAVFPVYIDPDAKPVTCFKLFGNMESCMGPVGSLTLYAAIGVAGVLFLLGSKR
jgi:hypothetical protein